MSAASNYGGASVRGVDLDAGVEIRVTPRVAVKIGARWLRMGFAFDGSGQKTARDANPDQDVAGAVDEYLGGYTTASWLF